MAYMECLGNISDCSLYYYACVLVLAMVLPCRCSCLNDESCVSPLPLNNNLCAIVGAVVLCGSIFLIDKKAPGVLCSSFLQAAQPASVPFVGFEAWHTTRAP